MFHNWDICELQYSPIKKALGMLNWYLRIFCGNLKFKEKRVILSEMFVWTPEDLLHCLGIASLTEEQPEPKPLLLTGFVHGKILACWSSTATSFHL